MDNEILSLIHKHGSVRHYKSDPVERELIEAIVYAGQRAATSSNLQMYSVVVTTDPMDRETLKTFCGSQAHISQAPVFLSWCADLSRLDRICGSLGYSHEAGYMENFLLAVVDTAIAAQNAGLAAESLGLGFCYIGAIRNNPRDVIQLLDLPKLTFPLVGMTLGWPAFPPPVRPRLPLDLVLHWGKYDFEGESALLGEYDQAMIDTGIYHRRQVPGRQDLSEKEYGWTEHCARRVSQVMRPHLREVLKELGFELH